MRKNNYLHVLSVIEDITGRDRKFDFDDVLDGSYNFNINDVSSVYGLVHIIEKIAALKDSLKCTSLNDTLLKEFKYQFKKKFYLVSRFYSTDESTYITRIPLVENEAFVSEQELMNQIEEKCISNKNKSSNICGKL